MPLTRETLLTYLDQVLVPGQFKDYCPNGLQVAGQTTVRKIVTGVSANQALIDAAIVAQADTLLVHHGFFWKGESPCLVGIKQKRIQALMDHHINLIAYHLPLDAHIKWGNNIQWAKRMSWQVNKHFSLPGSPNIGCLGTLPSPITAQALQQQLAQVLGRTPLMIGSQDALLKRIAWCSGAAQDCIDHPDVAEMDAFITGEVSERTVHSALEQGIHFYAAGHHATERYGVMALGAHLAQHFDIEHTFIEIPNPV